VALEDRLALLGRSAFRQGHATVLAMIAITHFIDNRVSDGVQSPHFRR